MKIQYVSEMNSNDDNKQARPPDHEKKPFTKMTYDSDISEGDENALNNKLCFSDAQHRKAYI